jgi:hypothetical protein
MLDDESLDQATRDALLVNDPNASKNEKDAAWERLVPVIERIALQVARRRYGLTKRVRRIARRSADEEAEEGRDQEEVVPGLSELEQEAVTHVYHKIGMFKGPNFSAWCRVVLKNLRKDLVRRYNKSLTVAFGDPEEDLCSESSVLPEPEAVQYDDRQVDEWLKLRREFEHALARMGDALGLPSGKGVDYFAVLLLYLRLNVVRIGARLAVLPTQGCDPSQLTAAELAEWLLPWRPADAARTFKPNWPTLQAIWELLATKLNAEPPPWPADTLPNLINSLAPPTRLNAATWTKRAREQAERHLDPAELEFLAKLM